MTTLGPLGTHAARALLVSFDGYMRPSSVLQLKSADIEIARADVARGYPTVAVTLAPLAADDGGEEPSIAFDDFRVIMLSGGEAARAISATLNQATRASVRWQGAAGKLRAAAALARPRAAPPAAGASAPAGAPAARRWPLRRARAL